jgi:uncharacterized protein YukE
MTNDQESTVPMVTQEINDAFDNVHCDMHNLLVVLEDIRALNSKGVDTGDAVDSLQSQIDDHYTSLERYYAQLTSLRDEIKAKADEVADLLHGDANHCEEHDDLTETDDNDQSEPADDENGVATSDMQATLQKADGASDTVAEEPAFEMPFDFYAELEH